MPHYAIECRQELDGDVINPVQLYENISQQDMEKILLTGYFRDDCYLWVSQISYNKSCDWYEYLQLIALKEPGEKITLVDECDICKDPVPLPETFTIKLMDITQDVCVSCKDKYKESWS